MPWLVPKSPAKGFKPGASAAAATTATAAGPSSVSQWVVLVGIVREHGWTTVQWRFPALVQSCSALKPLGYQTSQARVLD